MVPTTHRHTNRHHNKRPSRHLPWLSSSTTKASLYGIVLYIGRVATCQLQAMCGCRPARFRISMITWLERKTQTGMCASRRDNASRKPPVVLYHARFLLPAFFTFAGEVMVESWRDEQLPMRFSRSSLGSSIALRRADFPLPFAVPSLQLLLSSRDLAPREGFDGVIKVPYVSTRPELGQQ